MEPVALALIKERKNVLSRLRDHERIVCDLQTTVAHIDATLFHLGYHPDGALAPKKPTAAGLFYTPHSPDASQKAS